MPLAFGACVRTNLKSLEELPHSFLCLLVGVYAAAPLVLSALVLFKQRTLLYLLITECVALVLTSLSQPGPLPAFLYLVHYTLVIAMVVMAILLINRDILFPFALPSARGWRRSPRIEVNQRVKLSIPRLNATIQMMVEDASTSGISLYANAETVEKVAADIKPGEAAIMNCR